MRPTTFFLLIICNACDCYLVSNVAENELVWEMSELISKVASLICAVICEEDSDHSPGVRLDNRVRRHNCQPADQALPSLINKITGDTNNISQQLGWRQFGNHAIRKPDNHSQSVSQHRHRHGQLQSGALSLVQISPDTLLSLVEPYYAGAKARSMP